MPRIAGIVLAAGASARMGAAGPKALIRTADGETFLERAVRLCAIGGAEPIVVVTGAHVLDAPPPARAVRCDEWPLGQLRSLQAGIAEVERERPDAVLVALVDHPLVREDTVRALVRAFERTGAPVVRPVHQGRHGHPVIIASRLFRELREAPPSSGARPVVARWDAENADVEVDDPGILADLDTPEDLRRL